MRRMAMAGPIVASLCVAAVAAADGAADKKAACLDAASSAQSLRAAHKLVEARDALRVCAATGCPAVVQSDCVNWLAEVEKAMPTVVVSAKSGTGADLVDVKVTVDGKPFASKLDGQSVPMDAGPHKFHFEDAQGRTLDQLVMVREGDRNPVAVVLAGAPAAVAPAQAPVPAPAPVKTTAESTPAASSGSSGWRTVGWVLGGLGVAGLGEGAAAGVIALGDKSGAHCSATNVCDPGSVSGIKGAALASDVGFIAGGVLLGSGLALVLFGPRGNRETTGRIEIVPTMVARGGGVGVGGSW